MKTITKIAPGLTSLIAACAIAAAPMTAQAQSWRESHRQHTKNDWRNVAIAAGAVGLIGLFQHDNTLTFLGAAGALYSLQRYDHDRRSESKMDQRRAEIFHRGNFVRNGHHYARRTVVQHGHKYYRFVRTS